MNLFQLLLLLIISYRKKSISFAFQFFVSTLQTSYALDWPRDSAFINDALAEMGFLDEARRHCIFLANVQRKDGLFAGTWAQNFNFQGKKKKKKRSLLLSDFVFDLLIFRQRSSWWPCSIGNRRSRFVGLDNVQISVATRRM